MEKVKCREKFNIFEKNKEILSQISETFFSKLSALDIIMIAALLVDFINFDFRRFPMGKVVLDRFVTDLKEARIKKCLN